MEITQQEIKETVEKPDKMMNCGNCNQCSYVKKFRGKGELLVTTETIGVDDLTIKCFGWLESVLYPS